jgi:SnoaL-like polyketide cyclase
MNPVYAKEVSIVPDTHTLSEQDHLEVSPLETRLPLRSPNLVSLKAKHRIEFSEGRTTSVPFYLLCAGLTHLSDVRVCIPETPAALVTPLKPDSLHASKNIALRKTGELLCQNKTKLLSVVSLMNSGTRAICGWQTNSSLLATRTGDSSTPDVGRTPESEKKRVTLYRAAFPDMRLTIEDIIAEGETVVARWSCRGQHIGELNGIAPTGNSSPSRA